MIYTPFLRARSSVSVAHPFVAQASRYRARTKANAVRSVKNTGTANNGKD